MVAPDHPLAGKGELSFQEVLAYDLVSLERSSSNYLYLNNQARLAGHPMRVRVHVQNFNALIYMVEAGVGAAIVPASTAKDAIRQHKVAALNLNDEWAQRDLYLVYSEKTDQPELVREFAGVLLNDPMITAARGG